MVCLGLKTPGNRMVGSDETMELWQARLLHGVAILSLHCNKLFSVRELITNNGQCRGWLERSKYIIRKTHLVAVVTISGQAVGSNNGTVRSPAAELEVVAGLAVEQVGVGQDDAGAVPVDVGDDFVQPHAALLHHHLESRSWSVYLIPEGLVTKRYGVALAKECSP